MNKKIYSFKFYLTLLLVFFFNFCYSQKVTKLSFPDVDNARSYDYLGENDTNLLFTRRSHDFKNSCLKMDLIETTKDFRFIREKKLHQISTNIHSADKYNYTAFTYNSFANNRISIVQRLDSSEFKYLFLNKYDLKGIKVSKTILTSYPKIKKDLGLYVWLDKYTLNPFL